MWIVCQCCKGWLSWTIEEEPLCPQCNVADWKTAGVPEDPSPKRPYLLGENDKKFLRSLRIAQTDVRNDVQNE